MIRPSFKKDVLDIKLHIKDYIVEWVWYNPVSIKLRHLGRYLKRIITWAPVMWKSENWDYEYIYDLMELKMKELLTAQREDDIHDPKEVKRCIRQLEITLARMDRFRNWPNYYDYPTDDFKWVPCENGCVRLEHTDPDKDKQRLGAHDFETYNYNKFWKDFLKWHQNWWV